MSVVAGSGAGDARASSSPAKTPALGLAVNLPASASAADRQRALDQARATGVSVLALEVSWPAAEPRPRKYDVADVVRAARLLRQSGATLHLDLPLVDGRGRQVPADLSASRFDDPKLAARLGRLFEALGPALLDFSTLSLGNEADSYFAARPEELTAYLRLFGGAVEFLGKAAPRLLVGVATAAPMDSRAPGVAARLHEKSPAVFFVYAPFVAAAPFTHRPPGTLESDWKSILAAAAGRPAAFTEVSFSSSPENGSTPAKQADFVRRMRKFLATADPARLLFARYVPWRDPPPGVVPAAQEPSPEERRRTAFFANRGLQRSDGTAKPAWREWSRSGASGPTPVRPPRP
ncbi:MAG: hypothetical protein M3547_06485 [Acidobacteriota bacterium]|nr:hypothetical protein [Acidobacteriota bacterium]